MKENIKMYYNTMKPMGNWEESVDFTKNDRWGFCEKFSEMRGGVKKEYNNKEIGKNKNFQRIAINAVGINHFKKIFLEKLGNGK